MKTIIDLLEYAISSKEKREILASVPPRCVDCELLGICRDKENGYKCRHGCIIINQRKTLPEKCQSCILLVFCRDEYNNFNLKRNKCMLRRKGEEYKL